MTSYCSKALYRIRSYFYAARLESLLDANNALCPLDRFKMQIQELYRVKNILLSLSLSRYFEARTVIAALCTEWRRYYIRMPVLLKTAVPSTKN